MFVVCISASNIKHARDKSTSLKVCRLIKEMVDKATDYKAEIEIIPVVDYEFQACIGCGECFKKDECVNDDDFNRIYAILSKADALFIVSAHYAPIPAKLSMLLEKIEQLAFLKKFNDKTYHCALFGKPVGIIGHGGGEGDLYKQYKTPVIDSIWNALSYPVEMNIIGVDNEQHRGVVFPVGSVKRESKSIFPIQEYDWNDIESRLRPLVSNVVNEEQRVNTSSNQPDFRQT